MSTQKKIYINTIAQIGSKLLTGLIALYMIKVLSKYLGVEGQGLHNTLYTYLSFFAVIADLGLYTITVRELSKHQNNPKEMEKISGNVLSLRALSGTIIIILSFIIALFIPGLQSGAPLAGVVIVAFFTLFGLLNSSMMSFLQAILKTEFSIIANTSGKLLTFLSILAMTFWWLPADSTPIETRLIGVLIAGLAGNILMTFLTYIYARKFQKVQFYWDYQYILNILKLSLPYGLALFFGAIFLKIDTLVLFIMENPEVRDKVAGLYSTPMKFVEVGMMYGTIFLNSLLPVLTLAIEEKRIQDVRKLSSKGFELLMGFGAGISVFLAFFSDKIILFVTSEQFLQPIHGFHSGHALQIVAWVFLFYFISSLANYILIAQNNQKKIIYINLAIAIINLIGNLIFIPYFSFVGAAGVTLASQIILVAITFYVIRNEVHKKIIGSYFIYLLFSAIIAGLFAQFISTYLPPSLPLFMFLGISGAIFGISYLGLWFASKKFQKFL